MITINLSDSQAKSLLHSLGWRTQVGGVSLANFSESVAKEVFIQLENQIEAKKDENRHSA